MSLHWSVLQSVCPESHQIPHLCWAANHAMRLSCYRMKLHRTTCMMYTCLKIITVNLTQQVWVGAVFPPFLCAFLLQLGPPHVSLGSVKSSHKANE